MSPDAVLVTGIGGLIGNAVARRLSASGRRVIGMDNRVPEGLPFPVMTHDLPDPHRWHEAIVHHRIDSVIHAGGISGPMLLRDAPDRVFNINLVGLQGLLEAARIHRLRRLVCFSSVVAYGDQPGLPEISEDSCLRPTNVYGATKAAGDSLISAWHAQYGVDAVSLRVAACYGPGRTTPCVIRMMIEDALAGRTSRVREDPARTRQFIHVDDVVDAVIAALDAQSLPSRSYNIGPGRLHHLEEVLAAIRQSLPSAHAVADPDGMPWNSFGIGLLRIDAARRDLGFEPATGLAAGVRDTLAWVRQRQSADAA
jgi:UDP-glucose 4-epimerase